MSDLVRVDNPKVTSLEKLAELAKLKKAVKFNGIIKPAAVVLHMQGAVIANMIRSGNLFEYIKPVSEKKPLTFYRSGKAKRPLYEEIKKQNGELKEAIRELVTEYESSIFIHELDTAIERAKQLIQE